MAWQRTYTCPQCGYRCTHYEGSGFFGQRISSIVCLDCRTVQPLTVGGVISEVVPSFASEYGRLCPACMSQNIRLWNARTCPKCQAAMTPSDDRKYWT